MYSPNIRCLFIHLPKVAGNSIMRALGTNWEDHKDLARYHQELGEQTLQDLFCFTFVRNPWERILSEYNFQRKKSQRPDTVRLYLYKKDGSVRTFSEWVDYALSHPEQHCEKSWGGKVSQDIHRMSPQVNWISLNGDVRVNFAGRYERLQDDFDTVCDHLRVPRRKLGRKNGKFHWHYSHYFDRATRDRVANYYQADIETFGYQFTKNRFVAPAFAKAVAS